MGLIPEDRWHALRLERKGRSRAREGRVEVVPQVVRDATLSALDAGGRRGSGPVVAAMVRLQLLTGMRPAEVCGMRPADIDRSGPIW